MAPKSYWKGYLKLSLVTCPIQMMPATGEGGKLRFRTLNRATGHPVVSRSIDAVTGAVVAGEDTVRGYPRGEDDHVMLEDDELDAVALDSTRTIDIETFVDAADVAWIWYDRPYYIVPSDPVGEEAFAVIRAAMEATQKAGISRLVMGGRERAVLLLPRLRGIVLWTLRYGDEVRDAGNMDWTAGKGPEKALLDMVCKLIDARTVEWSPDLVTDPVQDHLLALIAEKRKTPKKKTAPEKAKAGGRPGGDAGGDAKGDNVVSIMDALKRSLSADKKR